MLALGLMGAALLGWLARGAWDWHLRPTTWRDAHFFISGVKTAEVRRRRSGRC